MRSNVTVSLFDVVESSTRGGPDPGVQDEVLGLLHGAEHRVAAPLEVVGAGAALQRAAAGRGLVIAGDETLTRAGENICK